MPQKRALIDLLRHEEAVSPEQLDRALARRRETGEPLAEVLVLTGALAEDDLFFLLSRGLGAPTLPEERLANLTLGPELRRRVPRALARRGVLVPIDLDASGRRLSVAMLDPSEQDVLTRLRRMAGVQEVRAYLARRTAILAAIDAAYGVSDLIDEPSVGTVEGPPVSPEPMVVGDTQVELIPGKVSLDPSLFQEMAALSPALVEESLRQRQAPPAPTAPPVAKPIAKPPAAPPPVAPPPVAQPAPAKPPKPPSRMLRPLPTGPAGPGRARPSAGPIMPALPDDALAEPPPVPRDAVLERRGSDVGPALAQLRSRSARDKTGDDELQATRIAPRRALKRESGEVDVRRVAKRESGEVDVRRAAKRESGEVEVRREGAADGMTPIDRQTYEQVRDQIREQQARREAGHAALEGPTEATDPQRRIEGPSPGSPEDTPVLFPAVEPPTPPAELSERTRVDARLSDFGMEPTPAPQSLTDEDEEGADDLTGETVMPPAGARPPDFAGAPTGPVVDTSRAQTSAFDTIAAHAEAEEEALLLELQGGIAVLVSLLEERVDPGAASAHEHGRLARAIARELSLDETAAGAIAVAAQLYAFEALLRREQGGDQPLDVLAVFDRAPGSPSRLNPALRALGARCLGLLTLAPSGLPAEGGELPLGVSILRLVADYLDLSSSDADSDLETVAQLLRTGGADPLLLDAIVRAVEEAEGTLLKTERSSID